MNPLSNPLNNDNRPNSNSVNDLAKIFNTAVVATRANSIRDFSTELREILETPELAAILGAVKQHARFGGVSERQASEQIIRAFRNLDQVWADYIFQEGVDRVQGE